eukprot:6196732-Pleurochrysis_carterae.AAC.3
MQNRRLQTQAWCWSSEQIQSPGRQAAKHLRLTHDIASGPHPSLSNPSVSNPKREPCPKRIKHKRASVPRLEAC